jgi:hypothetical protein
LRLRGKRSIDSAGAILVAMAVQARAQVDTVIARARLQQQKSQNAAMHLQVKTQGEIELAEIKAALEMTLLETHLKAAIEATARHRGVRECKCYCGS